MTPDQKKAVTLIPGGITPDGPQNFPPKDVVPEAEIKLPFNLGNILVKEVLAKGGMGMTFIGNLAKDPSKRVVIKIPLTQEIGLLERFKNEVHILSKLDHPNIVRFVASGENDIQFQSSSRRLPWLAMEYVSGASLRLLLKKQPRARWEDVYILLEHVLQALTYVHTKNLCHRDIKPDNLIHDPKTNAWKLVDFGIAKELIATLQHTMTMVESNPGAWDYMSPEQSRGKPVDIRSDIYSLGLTAWEALIGEVPRPGTAFPSALLGPENIPPDVDKLIARMTAHQAEDRFKTPTEALTALREGAGVIEEKEKGRKQRSKLLRGLAATTATALASYLIWTAGDQFQTQRVKDMVDLVPQSDTRYTHLTEKLDIFRRDHAFWGRRYADDQYAKAKQISTTERRKMMETFATIKTEIEALGRSDEYKFNRCEAFCKSYKEAFGETPEVKELLIQRDIFDAKTIVNKADALTAKGQTKQAVDLCDQHKNRFSLPEAGSLVTKARVRIAEAYGREQLTEVEALLAKNDEAALGEAQTKVLQLEKVIGPTPATQAALKQVDDLLWKSASNQADSALTNHQLETALRAFDRYAEISELKGHKTEVPRSQDQARRRVDDELFGSAVQSAQRHLQRKEYNLARADYDKYLEGAPLKAHREEAASAKDKVGAAEDDNDWEIVSASSSKNLAQRSFKQASDDYQNYLQKWPSGRHPEEAKKARAEVVGKHFQFLGDIKNYEDFLDEFNKVFEMYPAEQAQLQRARKWLVYHTHAEICSLWEQVGSQAMLARSALDKLGQIKYAKAQPADRQYLDGLVEAEKNCLQNRTLQTINYFLYILQRPPADCVTMPNPTVFYIQLHSVTVSLSESVYKKIKGSLGFDADPYIKIHLCRDLDYRNYSYPSKIFSSLGAVNQRSFSLTIQESVYFEKGVQTIDTVLDDADLSGENSILRVLWTDTTTGTSQSSKKTFPDGSTITLYYTQK